MDEIRAFLAKQGYPIRQNSKLNEMIVVDSLEHYLTTQLGIHWQRFGGTVPFAQYLDADVLADIETALGYWKGLQDATPE